MPRFILTLKQVEWKPNNHLPLVNLLADNSYFQDARNLLLNGPLKKAFTINIPPNKVLLSTFGPLLLSSRVLPRKVRNMNMSRASFLPEMTAEA